MRGRLLADPYHQSPKSWSWAFCTGVGLLYASRGQTFGSFHITSPPSIGLVVSLWPKTLNNSKCFEIFIFSSIPLSLFLFFLTLFIFAFLISVKVYPPRSCSKETFFRVLSRCLGRLFLRFFFYFRSAFFSVSNFGFSRHFLTKKLVFC